MNDKLTQKEMKAAKEAWNKYQREWYQKNKEKRKAYNLQYWAKRAKRETGE